MREIQAEECAILTLVLKGKWYDMIACCDKGEEYRDATKYWDARIGNWNNKRGPHVVEFRRGYHRNAPRMWFVVGGVYFRIGEHNISWGEPIHPHYAISLRERVKLVRKGGAR